MPTTRDEWRGFLLRYREAAGTLFDREGWQLHDSRWHSFEPATEEEIQATEKRLGVFLPQELRSFYQACNGWPADGWFNPAINRIAELDWLQAQNPSLYQLAVMAQQAKWKNRADDDPDLLAYREQQGTRVMRCLAITFDHDDQAMVMLDPVTDWRLGTWAHWHSGMSWTNASFSAYMVERLARLVDE